MNQITYIYPYYENPMMLYMQLGEWLKYNPIIREHISIIIVDDHSKQYPAEEVLQRLPKEYKWRIKLFRVDDDIPWNQHGAKNLGFKQANGWCLSTDMDMVIPEKTIEHVIRKPLDSNKYYTFDRIKMPFRELHRYHCNSFLIHTDAFWETGGYDEDYCGTYGGDGPFKRILDGKKTQEHITLPLEYWGRTIIKDSGTNDLERTGFYKEEYRKRMSSKKGQHPTNPIRFQWHEVIL